MGLTFNIYLFNSNKKEAIQTQSVTTSSGESVIQDLGWYISDDVAYKGGNFYIGYFEEDIGGAQPYRRNYDQASFKYELPCLYIEPVKVDQVGSILDVSSYQNQPDSGGLGLVINVYEDFTELVIRNRNKFAYAIQQNMAVKVLNLVRSSTRINQTQRRTQEITIELHGFRDENVYVEGLISKARRAVKDLKKDFFYQPIISRKTLKY